MRQGLWILLGLWMSAAAVADEVRVTGDRVSLRSAPSLEAALLDRAMRGDLLQEVSRSNGWVAVEAPAYLDAWVAAEFLTNGVVVPKRLNVRSGPNRNYEVLAVVEAGDRLEERDRFHEWVQVIPPEGSRVWISESFTERVLDEGEMRVELEPVGEPTAALVEMLPVLSLTLDERFEQGVAAYFEGRLVRANPGLYQLVRGAEVVCLVRGRADQLEPLLAREVAMEGLVYRIMSSELAVLQPSRIEARGRE